MTEDGQQPDHASIAALESLFRALPSLAEDRDDSRSWKGVPPVVLVAEREDQRRHVHNLLSDLRQAVKYGDTARIPCAALLRERGWAEDETARGPVPLLTPEIARQLRVNFPVRRGRLRLPDFSLLRDVVEYLLPRLTAGEAGRRVEPEESLREYCWRKRRDESLPLRFLWALSGPEASADFPAGWFGYVLSVTLQPMLRTLPFWLWSRGCNRRLLRSKEHGWYAKHRGLGRGRRRAGFFFEHIENSLSRLRGGGETAVLEECERLLLLALLTDLRRAVRPSKLSPWRRRRAFRHLLLLEPSEEPDSSLGVAEGRRFLDIYREAVRETECAATVLLTTAPSLPRPGSASGASPELGGVGELERKCGPVSGGLEPLFFKLPEGGVPAASPVTSGFGLEPPLVSPLAEVVLEGTALLVVGALLAGWLVPKALAPQDTRCLGGTEWTSGQVLPGADLPEHLYEEVERRIADQNRRVAKEAPEGATVLTVAYLGAQVAAEDKNPYQLFDPAVPEIRGIAIAQQELNADASRDPEKVWLRVERFSAGTLFADAVEAAHEIVDFAGKREDFVGVVGFAQSRKETKQALEVLQDHEISVVGTTATANALSDGAFFRRVSPNNSRETDIEADFANRANIVEYEDGKCAPAEAAVVVEQRGDLYSEEIAGLFAGKFTASRPGPGNEPTATISLTGGGSDIHDKAHQVCELVQREPRTVVYWAARAAEFSSFLGHFSKDTPCANLRLNVLSGNELTTAALTGEYDNPWLRLYHAAHVLPAVAETDNFVAQNFNHTYASQYGEDDLWRSDGRAALAYDAMQVLATAANDVNRRHRQKLGKEDLSAVQQALTGKIQVQGASGYLDFDGGSQVSRDKPLVLLHHTEDGSEPVLACGQFALNRPMGEMWGPDGRYPCVHDEVSP
ncbi:hypothetical protein [Streptomyces sp. TP-A0874]|uniref:hypothetical protein n=1 Tax=Streptomyces sp. TP-A0874 TaxID=549819 RepID=UPI000853CF1B|nr:hypothetical protein [Streptomyces sp. TP-A0874]